MIGDLFALGSAACFAVANVTIVRGAAREAEDNGAFLSLLVTAAISGAIWLALGAARGFVPVAATAIAWFALAGVLTGFIGRVFLFASVQRLGAMRASAIKRLNPFFAVTLGVAVLGEDVTLGMGLIVASFALLVAAGARSPAGQADRAPGIRGWLNLGYVYGPVSALGYASGYLLRKLGLAAAPDPFLGTMVGTLVAAALFVATAGFNARYAEAVRSTFRQPSAWLFAAGVMTSFGQILYFAALASSPMSRVALIASMEVFVTLLLGVWLLKRRETLTPAVAAAAALGVAGTALIVGV